MLISPTNQNIMQIKFNFSSVFNMNEIAVCNNIIVIISIFYQNIINMTIYNIENGKPIWPQPMSYKNIIDPFGQRVLGCSDLQRKPLFREIDITME